jgi:hypothetical protein
MFPIYVGGGILLLLIIAVFMFLHWRQQAAVTDAYATPTPGASAAATSAPIQLADGETLGTPMIGGGVSKVLPDTKNGGLGQPIDGIECGGMEYSTLHIHTHLSIYYHGKAVQVPRLLGAASANAQNPQGCLYWIHTHAPDGIIHVESPVLAPTGSAGFDLGMLFDIWGQPLSTTDVAGLKGPVVAYVNGTVYTGDLKLIPLRSHQQIVLEIGTPTVPPPNYAFPPND